MGFLQRLFWLPKADAVNNAYATATTPDDIICAAIIESIARNFDDWSLKELGRVSQLSNYPNLYKGHMELRKVYGFKPDRENCFLLSNKKKEIIVAFQYNEYWDNWGEIHSVNKVDIPLSYVKKIYKAWDTLKQERRRLKRIADEKLAEMQRLESAWNLAENLLGLKRNEHGALVPIVKIPPDDGVSGL